MRRTSPERATQDLSGPKTSWAPDQVPTQRSDDPWSTVEGLARSRAPRPVPTAPPAPTAPSDPSASSAPATPSAGPRAAYTSPDGSQWSWDGTQWQPVLAEPVAVRWWRSRGALIGGSVVLAVLVVGGILAASPKGDTVTRAEQAAIRGALQSAGFAQLAHHADTLAYAASVDELIGAGFVPDPEVAVTVVLATATDFCLAAGPVGASPTAWQTQDGESSTSCE